MSSVVLSPSEGLLEGSPAALSMWTRTYLFAGALLFLSAAALPLDFVVSSAFQAFHEHGPGDAVKALNLFEVFAHEAGVGLILLAIRFVDEQRGRQTVRLAVAAFGAGLFALAGQMLVARARPNTYFETGWPGSVSDTFLGFLPWFHASLNTTLSSRDWHSFPSGHSATAAALAVGLGYLYPRGRWFFAALAALAMLQRVSVSAHFLSDVLAGGASASSSPLLAATDAC